MGFQTPQYKLSKLLELAGTGSIQLPDFQRGYKWDEERIRSLLVTVTLGHPLGVLMLLQTGNDQVRFKPKPIGGTSAAGGEPDLLLLDGQQRLTSLYQSLTGTGIVATEDARKKQVQRRFYIDVEKAVTDPGRRDEAIVALPGDGIERTNFGKDVVLDASTSDKEREHGYFPFRLVYDTQGLLDWLWKFPAATGDPLERTALIHRFQAEILTPMQSYEIPAIELDKDTSKGAVATVFEKVNTGGLPLNVFELLTATFAGDPVYFAEHGDDFRLNDDWQHTLRVLDAHPVLGALRNTDFLQAVTLLATSLGPTFTSARKEDVLRLELSEYLAWADKVRDALVWVAQFLHDEKIHRARDIPYPTQLVPLVVIRVLLGEDADIYGIRARLRQWFWCGILGELYGGATETRFARDVDQVPSWAQQAIDGNDGAPTPATVMAATFAESRLLSLRTRQSAAYKGIHALLMSRGCRDWRFHQSFDQTQYVKLDVDIHHVFPRKWCDDHEVDHSLRESIVNKTPLAGKTNRLIGGASPATYMPKLESSAGINPGELDEIVSAHLIDTEALRAADFERFFLARRRALLELVESAMGKRAQRDVEPDALSGGDEAPEAYGDEPDDPEDAGSDIDSVVHPTHIVKEGTRREGFVGPSPSWTTGEQSSLPPTAGAGDSPFQSVDDLVAAAPAEIREAATELREIARASGLPERGYVHGFNITPPGQRHMHMVWLGLQGQAGQYELTFNHEHLSRLTGSSMSELATRLPKGRYRPDQVHAIVRRLADILPAVTPSSSSPDADHGRDHTAS